MTSAHQHLAAHSFIDNDGVLRRLFRTRTIPETIASFFRRTRFESSSTFTASPCLVWQVAHDRRGYGVLSVNGSRLLAHRVAYQLAYGAPTKPVVRHLCHNPRCVNPLHLREGTHKDNHNDSKKVGRTPKGDRSGRRRHPEAFPVGEACPNSKLTSVAVMEIHRLYRTRLKNTVELGVAYGVSVPTINSALHGRSWKKEFEAAQRIYPKMEMYHRQNLGKKRWKFNRQIAEEFKREKDAGKSVPQIAAERGLSQSTVYKALRSLNESAGTGCAADAPDCPSVSGPLPPPSNTASTTEHPDRPAGT